MLEVACRRLSGGSGERLHRTRHPADAEPHHQRWDQQPENKKHEEKGAVSLERANEGGPILYRDEAPACPGDGGIGGDDVPLVEIARAQSARLTGYHVLDDLLRHQVHAYQSRIRVLDHPAVPIDDVDVSAHAHTEFGDITVERAHGGRSHAEHARQDAVELSLGSGYGDGDGDYTRAVCAVAGDVRVDRS